MINAKYSTPYWEPVRIVVGDNYDRAIAAMQLFNRDTAVPTTIAPIPTEEVTPTQEIVEVVADETPTAEPVAAETAVIADTAVPPTPTPLPPTPTPLQSRIVFQSNRDDDWEIFMMNSDGSNQIQLTFNEVDDNFPAASPDDLNAVKRIAHKERSQPVDRQHLGILEKKKE